MDIVVWLRSLGLGRYEAAFRDNEIDETVLPNLTAEDLKDLGVSVVGHRRKLLDAIAALRTEAGTKAPSSDAATTSSAPTVSPEDRAVLDESRHVWEQAMLTEITKAEAVGVKFGNENGITFLDFNPADQAKLDALYNDQARAEAAGLPTAEGTATPIYSRMQAVIASINSGANPGCAKAGDAS